MRLPRPAPGPTNFSSPVFVVRLTDDADAPNHSFVEVWDPGTGSLEEKAGARYGDAGANPGVDVLGTGLAEGDYAWCRQADGAGGLSWEVYGPLGTGGRPPGLVRVRAATVGVLPPNLYDNGASGVGATLTGVGNGALVAQDLVALDEGDLLLVHAEDDVENNGVYAVTDPGDAGTPYVLTRHARADSADELLGLLVVVEEGERHQDTLWLSTADADITVGTTGLPFIKIGADLEAYALTVEEADGSPSYAGVTTLQFDSADGFVVSSPAAGVARIDFTGPALDGPTIVAGGGVAWLKATVSYTAFAGVAATGGSAPIGITLAARSVIHASYAHRTTQWAIPGGSSIYASAGHATATGVLFGAYQLDAAPETSGPLFNSGSGPFPDMPDGFASVTLRLYLSAGANLSTMTAGAITIWVLVSTLP